MYKYGKHVQVKHRWRKGWKFNLLKPDLQIHFQFLYGLPICKYKPRNYKYDPRIYKYKLWIYKHSNKFLNKAMELPTQTLYL